MVAFSDIPATLPVGTINGGSEIIFGECYGCTKMSGLIDLRE
jgi:hypothetical protein